MSLIDVRDRALILTGFICASRRRNVSEFDVEDIQLSKAGMIVTFWREKNNQYGRKSRKPDVARIGGRFDPVVAMEAWIDAFEKALGRPLRHDDPLFCQIDRHGRIVALTPGQAEDRGGPHGYGPATHGGTVPARLSRPAINAITKSRAGKAGLPGEEFSSHCMRRGLINTLKKTRPREYIAKRAGFRHLDSMDPYYDDDEAFESDIGGDAGLAEDHRA